MITSAHVACATSMKQQSNRKYNFRLAEILEKETLEQNKTIAEKARHKHGVPTASNYLWVIKHLLVPHNKIVTRGL